jgi:cell division protein FtsL
MKYKTPIYSQQKMAEIVMILLRPALLMSAKTVIYTAHLPT